MAKRKKLKPAQDVSKKPRQNNWPVFSSPKCKGVTLAFFVPKIFTFVFYVICAKRN